jgi:tetratricopeptide (TPR) repeat protein
LEFIVLAIVLVGLTAFYLFQTMHDRKMKEAEKAYEDGNLDVALSIFMDSLKKKPDDVDTLWHLGNINEEKDNNLEAIGYYTRILGIGKESTLFSKFEVLRRAGLLYRKVDRDKEALDYLMQAYQLLSTQKDVIAGIADILFTQKQFYRTIPYYERGLPSMMDNAAYQKGYGFSLLMIDNINDSIGILEKVNLMTSHDMEVKYLLAYLYLRTGAYNRCREMVEEVVNSDKIILSLQQMYFAIKMLTMAYMLDKNFEVAKELHKKLEAMVANEENPQWREETAMLFIFMRIKQGYYDLALEKLNSILDVGVDTSEMNEQDRNKVKEKRSLLFELLTTMDKYKKEKDLIAQTGDQRRFDVNYSILEANAKDAKKQLDQIYTDWEKYFLTNENIWQLWGPKVSLSFDPTPILDRFSEETMKDMKEKFKTVQSKPREAARSLRALGIDPKDPCQSMKDMDFPSFVLFGKEIADRMGYRVLSDTIKIDQVAFSEGQGFDLFCEDKVKKNKTLIFVRRWREPIGFITIMNMLGALTQFGAENVILISTIPLTDEARNIVDRNDKIKLYLCDEIGHLLM